MPNSSNQNVSMLQQSMSSVESKVDGIALMLTTFDTRVSKLETRVDKLEEQNKVGMQWANDEHQSIREAIHAAKDAILAKMEESSSKTWEQRIGHIFATVGWVVAIALFLLGYLIQFLVNHH